MKYAFSALATNEYGGLELSCGPDEYIVVTIDGASRSVCPFESGDVFLETFNIESYLTIGTCQVCLMGMTGLCIFTSFLALRRLVRKGK